MAYESAHLSRFKLRYNSANDDNEIVVQLVRDGAKVTPASATIAIYKPGTSTAVLAATAMTVSGSLMVYAVDTTTTADFPVDTGYRARVVVTDANAVTYEEDIFFDVAELIGGHGVGRDQLLAMDARIRGMDHAGDEDFSEIIQACWDEMQFDIESRHVDGNQLLDTMIVDRQRLSIVLRYLVLSRIMRSAGHDDAASYYEDVYSKKFSQFLSGFKHDITETGEEDSEISICNSIRLSF